MVISITLIKFCNINFSAKLFGSMDQDQDQDPVVLEQPMVQDIIKSI